MLANQTEIGTGHYTESELVFFGKIDSLIYFLETNLAEFPNKIKISGNTKEPIINQKLLRFLESKSSFFKFIPENLDEKGKNKSKPDLGVYEKDFDENGFEVYDDDKIRFFDIECKRLNSNLSHQHVSQYVLSDTGGIQRFKENKHGVNLSHSAMIGYVETNDFDFWHKKVNSWIADQIEHLTMIENHKIAKLESEHFRINSSVSNIKLTHFWLKMMIIDNK